MYHPQPDGIYPDKEAHVQLSCPKANLVFIEVWQRINKLQSMQAFVQAQSAYLFWNAVRVKGLVVEVDS